MTRALSYVLGVVELINVSATKQYESQTLLKRVLTIKKTNKNLKFGYRQRAIFEKKRDPLKWRYH